MSTLPLSFFHTRSRGHIAVSDMVNNNDGWAMFRWLAWVPLLYFFHKRSRATWPSATWWTTMDKWHMTTTKDGQCQGEPYYPPGPFFLLSFFYTRISGHIADGGMKCNNRQMMKKGNNEPWLPNGKRQPPTMLGCMLQLYYMFLYSTVIQNRDFDIDNVCNDSDLQSLGLWPHNDIMINCDKVVVLQMICGRWITTTSIHQENVQLNFGQLWKVRDKNFQSCRTTFQSWNTSFHTTFVLVFDIFAKLWFNNFQISKWLWTNRMTFSFSI